VGRKVLITPGGRDPDNATSFVVLAIESVGIEPLEVVVALGAPKCTPKCTPKPYPAKSQEVGRCTSGSNATRPEWRSLWRGPM
jgi:hypothetical protein